MLYVDGKLVQIFLLVTSGSVLLLLSTRFPLSVYVTKLSKLCCYFYVQQSFYETSYSNILYDEVESFAHLIRACTARL